MKTQPADYRASERQQAFKRTYLYRFNYEGTNYYFACYDENVVVNGGPGAKMANPQSFTAAQIAHTRPDDSLDAAPGMVTVSLDATDTELRKYFVTASSRLIEVEIWRVSSNSLPGPIDYADDMRMIFSGIVDSLAYDDQTIMASCTTRLMRDDMPIPRFFYQKMCNHMLYDQSPGSCQVNPTLFQVSLTVDVLNRQNGYVEFVGSLTTVNVDSPSRSITVTTETFQGGVVQDSLGNEMGVLVCEVLTSPTRTRLWLNWMPRTLAVGQTVTIQLGCMRIKRVCHAQFNNLPNFGGTPYIPISNPAIDGVFN